MILIHWAFIFLGGSGVAFGESSNGAREVDEDEVAFGFGSKILTLDFDFLGEVGLG